ncbi:MAG: DUF1080 domain-containing protein [Verrucomicrobiota bacterium]
MNYLRSTLILISACGTAFAADGWTDLFNGKDLDGWVQRGGKATYAIEDGSIVGTSTLNTSNTFLCTARDYSDFILEYEFKVDPKLNSGVQIRSNSLSSPSEITWEGKTIKIAADRVHGYQIEIDPNPVQNRWWAAGIYDEARRGWLYPGSLGGNAKEFTDQGRKIFKQGDWNKVRVEAIGDSIKTTLNGTPCASIKDSLTSSGFIALQVHDIGKDKEKEGTQVRWRNLRIREVSSASNTLSDAEKAEGWSLLWDGKTSEGWRSVKGSAFPTAGWEIKDGLLIINETGGAESAAAGDIITRKKYSDFELQLEFKITPGANSGIKTFVDPELNKGPGSAIGPEFQILDDERHPDAKLGRPGTRTVGSLYDMQSAPADKKVKPVGEWNTARILSNGKQLTYWLNGVKTIDIERGGKEWRDLVADSKYKIWPNFGELPEGHILLQDHGNQVFYKNIKIRDFSKK